MRKALGALLLILPSLLFAMGGQPTVSTLIPAKLVDKTGKVHQTVSLVCNDRTYFTFKDGAVEVKVPFEKIKKLVVLEKKGEDLKVKVIFKDNNSKVFLIPANTICTGATKYGSLEVYLEDLKKIEFLNTDSQKGEES